MAWISWAMLAIAAISVILGAVLFLHPKSEDHFRNLGIGFLSTFSVTVVIFVLQLSIADSAKQQQEAADKAAAEQTFRLTLAVTNDLTGFSPNGYSLAGAYLNGKIFNSADFSGADLQGSHLRGANLRNVNAPGANLSHADLSSADLTGSILTGADLTGANLQGATFEQSEVEDVKSLEGASVNALTCWPRGFLDVVTTKWHLVEKEITVDPNNPTPASFGTTCPGG